MPQQDISTVKFLLVPEEKHVWCFARVTNNLNENKLKSLLL